MRNDPDSGQAMSRDAKAKAVPEMKKIVLAQKQTGDLMKRWRAVVIALSLCVIVSSHRRICRCAIEA